MERLSAFLKNNADMLNAAERCIEVKQLLPALVLMYSHIDTLAWAWDESTKASVRDRFEKWVERWLLPQLRPHAPGIKGVDLYAARCAVLHTLTGKSDLSKAGKAREVAYAWGNAPIEVLRGAVADSKLDDKLVALHYRDLLISLRRAVADFVSAGESDKTLAAALERAASQHYSNIPHPVPGTRSDA